MEWLMDPTIWVGLLTLVVLEIILGIDNLVFIAILANKLPVHQRERARITGITCAMLMRLLLLSIMSSLIKLTTPLFTIGNYSFSGKDLILIAGGIFLIAKATMELHERLEGAGADHSQSSKRAYASFGVVVTQIVVLDAIFSLDSVITAVGMVKHLSVMMMAVIIAMSVMLIASKPLTRFVSAHSSVVVLCLSFLLLIGFSLIAEGFHLDIPKQYIYAAIGFSILIEFFNQVARRNILKAYASKPLRARTADAVLGLLGKREDQHDDAMAEDDTSPESAPRPTFHQTERNMVHGVLTLAERSVDSIMTPRADIAWIDAKKSPEQILSDLRDLTFSSVPICQGSIDEIIGIARAKELVEDILVNHTLSIQDHIKPPIIVPETIGILELIETLQRSRGQLVLVADEFGSILGLVTPIDVFEAIAGEFPDENETLDIQKLSDNRWLVSGAADLHHLEQELDVNVLVDDDNEFSTLAGYILEHLGRLPTAGEVFHKQTLSFEILKVEHRRIEQVIIEKQLDSEDRHGN